MKYDSIIIGGGISGLVCGIKLLKAGKKVAIVSSGQSALHFNSGAIALFGRKDGKDVLHPLDEIARVPEGHPYAKLGMDTIKRLLPEVKPLFAEAGITLVGSDNENHYRLTPTGMFKPAWLSMLDYASVSRPDSLPWGKVAIINITGFLDFYPDFIARGLNLAGLQCEARDFTVPELETLRKSSTEMRATNIARFITGDVIRRFAAEVNRIVAETHADTVLMPAIIGLFDEEPVRLLKEQVVCPLYYVSTMPMSLCGMRAQMRLRNHFQHLGGAYLIGDTVCSGNFDGGRLKEISTVNLGDMTLEADRFVLATGSFFSHGLEATPNKVFEPIFNLDVNVSGPRVEWCDVDLYKDQQYMKFGVVTDESFHVYKDGRRIDNMQAIGAVAGGHDALKEESGGGVAILTALKVASDIINELK